MTKRQSRLWACSRTILAAAALMPGAAWAQSSGDEADSEIVVTAQRREEAQVDVPISITNLSAETLQTANVSGLADIAKVTPALRFDANGGGFVQPSIRGIGTAVTTSGGGANVGIYIDGFYSPNPLAADFELLSVDSIQVLKGPQGTLFGRNTTGGAIIVQTREPSTVATTAEGRLGYGRFARLEGQGLLNLAASESIALSVEGRYAKGHGFQRDISSSKRVGDFENWGVRFGVKAELSEGVSVLLRYQHDNKDDPRGVLHNTLNTSDFGLGAPFGGIPGTFTTKDNEIASGTIPEFFKAKTDIFQGTIKADLGFADFTSLTQYRTEKIDASLELDYSGLDIFQLGLPVTNKTWSQELLLTSKPGPALQWTAGLFYFQNSDRYVTHIDNAGSSPARRLRLGGSGTLTKSYAAFLDGTYALSEQLFLTAGLRYSKDSVNNAFFNTRFLAPVLTLANGTTFPAPGGRVYLRDFQPAAVDFAKKNKVTPRVVLRYKPNEDTSLYASYTKGYKSAIMDVGGTCQNPPYRCNLVKPESIDAFELGAKYDGNGLSVEVAGFYYDYSDLQVSLFEAGTAAIVNAASSEIYGLEGQVNWKVSPQFRLMTGASLVHARYKDFPNAPIYTRCSDFGAAFVSAVCAPNGLTFIVTGRNLKNSKMQRTPGFTGFLGGRYEADVAGGELALSGNLYYSSSIWLGPSGTQFRQGGYETVSLRAQWTAPDERYHVALWGDNVTNSRFISQATFSNFGIGKTISEPATYGIEVGFRF